MSYTKVLPSLLHPTSTWIPKGGDQPLSHRGYSEKGTCTSQSVWGFPPPLGETHLVSKLYFGLHTDAAQMAPQPLCLKPLRLPGGRLGSGRGEGKGVRLCQAQRWLGSGNSKCYSLCLILTTKYHCFWPSA